MRNLTERSRDRLVKQLADWVKNIISNLGQQGLGERKSRGRQWPLLPLQLIGANHILRAYNVPVLKHWT